MRAEQQRRGRGPVLCSVPGYPAVMQESCHDIVQQQTVNMKRREVFPFKIIVALSMQQLIFCFKVHYLLQLLNLKVLSVTDSSGKKVSA